MKGTVLIILLFLSDTVLVADEPTKDERSWSGAYLRDDGKYRVVVNQWERDAIEADIFTNGSGSSETKDGFVAFIRDNRAEHRDIREPNGCRIIVKRDLEGLEIEDLCSGTHRLDGFYPKQK